MKEGWKYISEIAKVIHGKNQKEVACESGPYPIYGSGGTVMGYASEFLCPEGTTILGRKGTIDNPIFIDHKFWNVDTAFGIVANEDCNKKYLYYGIKNIDWKSLNTGTTLPSLTQSVVLKQAISFPPLSEQQRIVEHLDSAFAKIDALKANTEKMVEEAKALFASALREAMTPKEGWEEKTLPEISENLDGRRRPVTKGKRSAGIYPYYGASGIVDYVDSYIYDEDILLISEDGANLIARSTPIAFSVTGKVWVNNHAHVVRFETMTTQRFVEYYFSSIKIDEYVTGAAQPKLTQKNLNIIPIPLPPLNEQQRIVAHLDSLSAKIRQMEANYKKESEECDALKQAILREIFE